jgi:hypothetical protein
MEETTVSILLRVLCITNEDINMTLSTKFMSWSAFASFKNCLDRLCFKTTLLSIFSNTHLLAAAVVAAAGQSLTHLPPLASVAAVEVQNPPPARPGLEVERPPCRPKEAAAGRSRSQSLSASIQ